MNAVALTKMAESVHIDQCSAREVYDAAMYYAYGDDIPELMHEEQIKKLMVNNIRHKHSNYMDIVYKVDAIANHYVPRHYIFRNSVLYKIADQYPYLSDECTRQTKRITMVRSVER